MEINRLVVPSRTAVRKAGKTLTEIAANNEEKREALKVLSSWRAAHSVPINTLQAFLRNKVKALKFSSPIVAQRLKRTPSILRKLERFSSMDLDRMQDIGGLRVIVSSIQDVDKLYEVLNSKHFKHSLVLPPNDYIQKPKPDGYRSLHQVIKYKNVKHPEFDNMRVELQIRTKLQHSWATAVETLGMLEKCSFKTGEGNEKIREFFRITSALFSIHEGRPVLEAFKELKKEDLVARFNDLESELSILRKLEGVAVSANHIQSSAKKEFDGYHVIQLYADNDGVGRVILTPFYELSDAEGFYSMKEQETKENPNVDVVLVSAGALKDIRKAYPNYFLNTTDFLKNIRKLTS